MARRRVGCRCWNAELMVHAAPPRTGILQNLLNK
jgi:hypothetical protein